MRPMRGMPNNVCTNVRPHLVTMGIASEVGKKFGRMPVPGSSIFSSTAFSANLKQNDTSKKFAKAPTRRYQQLDSTKASTVKQTGSVSVFCSSNTFLATESIWLHLSPIMNEAKVDIWNNAAKIDKRKTSTADQLLAISAANKKRCCHFNVIGRIIKHRSNARHNMGVTTVKKKNVICRKTMFALPGFSTLDGSAAPSDRTE
mmetsp:Transcript_11777/g.23939  ORF Transcript_11777/g.23939 Transcript_11777/m.23939 type:complete len:202 (+) Transcript_11777:910-1515(+)